MSLLSDSGNGAHNLYKIDLANDADAADLVKRFLESLSVRFSDAVVSVDTVNFNASRICKLYGTATRKGSNTPTRPWRKSRILESPESLETVSKELLQKIINNNIPKIDPGNPDPKINPGSSKKSNNDKKTTRTARPGTYTADQVEKMMGDCGLTHKPAAPYDGGIKWELVTCPWSDDHTTGDGGAAVFLMDGIVGFKCQHAHCADRHAVDVFGAGVNGGKAAGANGIIINNRSLGSKTKDALEALIANNDPPTLFVRGSKGGAVVELTGGAVALVNIDRMKNLLDKAATWHRKTKDGNTEVSPPEEVARNILVENKLPFPQLAGIIHTPVFTKDGLLTTPGYDPQTGLYLDTNLQVDVSNNPEPDDVNAARNLILDVLCDFPFRAESDKANALAMILLPFVRPLIDGPTPLHLVDAPTQGTGKGLLVEVFSSITTGSEAKGTDEPRTTEEWGKVITSALMTAPPYVFFDNINRPLESSALASATTARIFSSRVLGQSKMVDLPVTNAWLATGNNVKPSGEIARRVVHIRLDAVVENPALRTGFKHPNLIRFVNDHRGELVHACLTLASAWAAAGRPIGNKTLGSYESWVGVMGGMLDVAGIPGFLENVKDTMNNLNTSDAENKIMVDLWWTIFGTEPVTASELLIELDNNLIQMADVETARTDRGRSIKLGQKLGNLLHRVFDGKRVEKSHDKHHASTYRLVEVPVTPPINPDTKGDTSGVGDTRIPRRPARSNCTTRQRGGISYECTTRQKSPNGIPEHAI